MTNMADRWPGWAALDEVLPSSSATFRMGHGRASQNTGWELLLPPLLGYCAWTHSAWFWFLLTASLDSKAAELRSSAQNALATRLWCGLHSVRQTLCQAWRVGTSWACCVEGDGHFWWVSVAVGVVFGSSRTALAGIMGRRTQHYGSRVRKDLPEQAGCPLLLLFMAA